MDDLWKAFTLTGKVDDYLKYKKSNQETENANENQGLDNKRTDYRGE